jgi:hypothetical protein
LWWWPFLNRYKIRKPEGPAFLINSLEQEEIFSGSTRIAAHLKKMAQRLLFLKSG